MPLKQESKAGGRQRTPHGRRTRPGTDRRGSKNTAKGNAGSGQGKAKN